MPIIKKLSSLEARKIAAGEVVERPSNIVKELIENSLDAHATMITITVEDGGKRSIRVIDNGSGMDEEDAILCFEHHATSKISSLEDLEQLGTFGFRGEALSSIAAISKVTLITKTAVAQTGIKLVLEHGVVSSQEAVAYSVGTDILIEDIFYNVPARLKFLKKAETEWRQILLLFQAYCLAYPAIHFKLEHNGAVVVHCPPVAQQQERLTQLWGHEFNHAMLPCQSTDDYGRIEGFVSNHQVTQFNKHKIFFFINKRWVKNIELSRALLKGYLNVLPDGKYPIATMFIEVLPDELDVNIHPRKEEVRLLHAKKIEHALQQLIRQTLEKQLSQQLQKAVLLQAAKPLPFEKSLALYANNNATSSSVPPLTSDASPWFTAAKHAPDPVQTKKDLDSIWVPIPQLQQTVVQNHFDLQSGALQEQSVVPVAKQEDQTSVAHYAYTIIGQFKKTYILLEQDDALLMVDQHAAHERILFELFSTRFTEVATIRLLFPHVITLTHADIELIGEHLSLLQAYGIEAERFGPTQLVINATPVHLKDASLDELIRNIVEWLQEGESPVLETVSYKLCAQMACKAAVKAGDVLPQEQMHQLLNDLYAIDNRFTCPHGRPTCWTLSLDEIEKKFKRKI